MIQTKYEPGEGSLKKKQWRIRGTREAKGADNGVFMVTIKHQTGNFTLFLQPI